MNGEVEELLREGLDRLTAEVQVPAGVAGRARAHRRYRRIVTRTALACGTAAVTAAAVIAATGPGQGAGAPVRARTAAYVIQRMENALANTTMVMKTETTFSPAFPKIMQWTYRGNVRIIQSGFMPPAAVQGLPWAQGQESWGVGTAMINGKRAYVQVDYRRHEWYATSALGFAPNGCSSAPSWAEDGGPGNWATYVHQAVSCGEFTIAGHAWTNGTKTIKITGSMTEPDFWVSANGQVHEALHVDVTLYVDPATYLPVRVIWKNSSQTPDGKPLHGTVRQDIRILPPTPRNIAMASVTVPAGFRTVPDSSFGGPVLPFFGMPGD
jgi:hypothetical protein